MTWRCESCGEVQQGPTVICKKCQEIHKKSQDKESVKYPWICAGCGDEAPPSLVCKKCKEKSLADSKTFREQSKNRRFNVGDFFLPKVVSIEITEVKHESHLTVYPYTVLVSIRGDEDPSIITKEAYDYSEENLYLKGAGCIRMAEAIRGLTGDSWSMLACVDFLVEKKEIVEIKQAREPAGQYRIFVRPMEY